MIFSEEARCDFWSGKWDLELAYTIYDWAKGIVSTEANFKDPKIGYFMETSFVNMCMWTCELVVAPRCLTANTAHHPIPALRVAGKEDEDVEGVYERFRSIHSTAFRGDKNFGTIEDIWVHGYIGRKRKAAVDSGHHSVFQRGDHCRAVSKLCMAFQDLDTNVLTA